MRLLIEDIEVHLPTQVITNEDLAQENPDWDMARVVPRSGVLRRHVAAPGETALDLAKAACARLFERHAPATIDGLVFCTQTPDYILPSNAFLIHRHFRMPERVLAFDYNLACSGFVYGLAIVRGLLASGQCRRAVLVTADTYSKLINRRDRSARTLFGDGAAATLLSASPSEAGIVDIDCATAGSGYKSFYVPAGGCRQPCSEATAIERLGEDGNVRSDQDIHMDGMAVWAFVSSAVPRQVRRLLERNRLALADVDLYIFHQASKLTLDSLAKALGLSEHRMLINIAEVGNTVSASIPIALKEAWTRDRIRAGDRVVLAGFGVGLSSAAALMRV